jgi:3-hydroxy-D-aspartate aldolase
MRAALAIGLAAVIGTAIAASPTEAAPTGNGAPCSPATTKIDGRPAVTYRPGNAGKPSFRLDVSPGVGRRHRDPERRRDLEGNLEEHEVRKRGVLRLVELPRHVRQTVSGRATLALVVSTSASSTGLGPNEHLIGVPGSRHRLGTPSLVIDLDLLDANIRSLAEHAARNGYLLRPPAKIHKCSEIAHLQVAAGAIGVSCATLAEAEVLVGAGVPGVVLFSTVVTEPKLERLAALNASAEGLVVVTDGIANVPQLAAAAARSGMPLQVLVDYEVGGGRTGIADEDGALALAQAIAASDGLELAGLQGYVGEHQTVPDYDERRQLTLRCMEPLARLVERLRSAGLPPRIVSGGGTGSHEIDGEAGLLTEVQAGTYVLMDGNYLDTRMRRDEPHPFACALSVRTTVIGSAQPGFAITDAGTKEIDGMLGPLAPRILRGAPEGARYSIVGDDLGRIDLRDPGDSLAPGAVVELLPPHCYQTIAMYQVYHCVRGDELVAIWPIDALASW